MSKPKYTEEDMMTLARVSVEGSVPRSFLPGLGFSPRKFREFLASNGLAKDVHVLFDTPLREVPLLVGYEEQAGYVRFRMEVGK